MTASGPPPLSPGLAWCSGAQMHDHASPPPGLRGAEDQGLPTPANTPALTLPGRMLHSSGSQCCPAAEGFHILQWEGWAGDIAQRQSLPPM